jgi:hypothetical protein
LPTNFYFNNYGNSMEQRLLEELVMESIKIYGHDVYYMPMTAVNKDVLYGEVALAEFNSAYPIEMYIKNVDGFGGQGTFLSKFNIEIREEIEFSISSRVFAEEVGVAESLVRPREGDLIWFPLASRLFKISFVDSKPVFYQLGTIAFIDLRCELYEYSNEKLNTGILEIDSIAGDFNISHGINNELRTADGLVLTDESGYSLLLEQDEDDTSVVSDNDLLQLEAAGIIDFTEIDPFSEGRY